MSLGLGADFVEFMESGLAPLAEGFGDASEDGFELGFGDGVGFDDGLPDTSPGEVVDAFGDGVDGLDGFEAESEGRFGGCMPALLPAVSPP